MTVLIKQATIVNSSSPFNGLVKDILIENGQIVSIVDNSSSSADQVIESEGLHVSIGWLDSFAHFCDPGYEFRETLETGSRAAAAGGFTDVMLVPNSNPVVHAKTQVEYLKQRSQNLPVNLHVIAAVTRNAEGKELAEMYDMFEAGATAFSDGTNAIQNGGLLLKALQYVKAINGIVIQVPGDKSIGASGLMNEGVISTQLGLPGKPAMAEELMVTRDIELNNYTNSRIHFSSISTAKSLDHIRAAKARGGQVSCAVTPYHLYFSDEDLQQYDTNLKVDPPLRTPFDRNALKAGLLDGTIDCFATHHIPQNYDAKVCEFEYARDGMIGLESFFGAVWSLFKNDLPLDKLIDLLTVQPRRLFGIAAAEIKEGVQASLTLFDPSATYVFEEKNIQSKSKNSAFTGKTLTGKVIGIVNGNHVHLN